jgi:2-desacetyl-2-hydroxyethyl bacteriochlorophyllide A dehydrogenase
LTLTAVAAYTPIFKGWTNRGLFRQMKQIILAEPGRFESRDVAAPAGAGPGEALVKVRKVGVCGSDFHAFRGRHPAYTFPRVIGHELSGVIVEVSTNDPGFAVGDRCAIDPYLSCGLCAPCAAGRTNCCEQLKLFGIHMDGGMQELLSVPLHLLHKSETLSFDQLALVETLGIGAHAVARSSLNNQQTALVVGAGPIGISAAIFAQMEGARVTVVEKNLRRREFVEAYGIRSLPEPDGLAFDVVFDATGNAEVMAASLNHVAAGGKLVYVGLTRDPVTIDDPLFHRKELTIFASRNSCGQFPRIIKLMEKGSLDTSPWVTDRLDLSEVTRQFAGLPDRPGLIKAMVDVTAA